VLSGFPDFFSIIKFSGAVFLIDNLI